MRPTFLRLMLVTACSAFTLMAADTGNGTMAQIHDKVLSDIEGEVVPLAEAMPAEKYDFAPTTGQFSGVRTFRLQMTHIATVIYEVASGVLGEKCPVDQGKNENGAESLNSKDAVVKYLKDAFAYAHRAMNSLTDRNFTENVDKPFGKMPRGAVAEIAVWHTYDHYGQAVVYLRMNGIVPPASRK